jgi:hypothetical protein
MHLRIDDDTTARRLGGAIMDSRRRECEAGAHGRAENRAARRMT